MVVDSVMWANFQEKLNISTTFEKSVQADVPFLNVKSRTYINFATS